MSRTGPSLLSLADVRRAIKAARSAGLDVIEVEVVWSAGQVRLRTVPAGSAISSSGHESGRDYPDRDLGI
jgi:hypothetical protein